MRLDHFEQLAPLCPRCLHGSGQASPLRIAETAELRGDRLWAGMLHCTDSNCWREFPVIDGVPIILPDPASYVASSIEAISARHLPLLLDSLLGDALGPESPFEIRRQHLSIYAHAHFSDWLSGAPAEPSSAAGAAVRGLELLAETPAGPALDLGCAPGRAGLEIAVRRKEMVLGVDLNFAMLRMAQQLALEGTTTFDLRLAGTVYERQEITLPAAYRSAKVDFWACDAGAMPFAGGGFALALALNLVDCTARPAQVIGETSRMLAPDAVAVLATPHDWSPRVSAPADWLGGHSQRAGHGGRCEPVFSATLSQSGLAPVAELPGVHWTLRLHARARMLYSLQMIACRKTSSFTSG